MSTGAASEIPEFFRSSKLHVIGSQSLFFVVFLCLFLRVRRHGFVFHCISIPPCLRSFHILTSRSIRSLSRLTICHRDIHLCTKTSEGRPSIHCQQKGKASFSSNFSAIPYNIPLEMATRQQARGQKFGTWWSSHIGGYYRSIVFISRIVVAISVITVLGLVANLMEETVSATPHYHIPPMLWVILVACIASFFWFIASLKSEGWPHTHVIKACFDSIFLIVFGVLAMLLGQPVASNLSTCSTYKPTTGTSLNGNSTSPYVALPVTGSDSPYVGLARPSNITDSDTSLLQLTDVNGQTACTQLSAVWGFIIALAIAFFSSAFFTFLIWLGERTAGSRMCAACQEQYDPKTGEKV
jgi:hypothetical protein